LLIHTWWERGAKVVPGLRISVRLYAADGEFYAQWDQPPVSPTFGQELWPEGVPLLSRFDQLAVPAGTPPGPAEIRLVLYDIGGAFDPFTVTLAPLTVQEEWRFVQHTTGAASCARCSFGFVHIGAARCAPTRETRLLASYPRITQNRPSSAISAPTTSRPIGIYLPNRFSRSIFSSASAFASATALSTA